MKASVFLSFLPTGVASLLALLFGYAALSKLLDYARAQAQMRNQVFPPEVSDVLTWAVPAAELLTVALLLYRPTRRAGLYASLGLLTVFSGYIGVVLTGIFGRVPCSCGGILGQMGYGVHLGFNLIFVALSLGALAALSTKTGPEGERFPVRKKERRSQTR